MDPRLASPDQWVLMTQAMHSLVLFAVLAINAAACMLVAHAVLPSLIQTQDVPVDFNKFRRLLYPIVAVSLCAAIFAFARAITLAIALVEQIYPSFVI